MQHLCDLFNYTNQEFGNCINDVLIANFGYEYKIEYCNNDFSFFLQTGIDCSNGNNDDITDHKKYVDPNDSCNHNLPYFTITTSSIDALDANSATSINTIPKTKQTNDNSIILSSPSLPTFSSDYLILMTVLQ